MGKVINVPFTVDGKEMEITLLYTTELEGDTHTINCKVDIDNFNAIMWHWLEARSFQLLSLRYGDEYAQLYTENGNINSTDTMLFIERAYEHIMAKENLPLVETY